MSASRIIGLSPKLALCGLAKVQYMVTYSNCVGTYVNDVDCVAILNLQLIGSLVTISIALSLPLRQLRFIELWGLV